MGYFSQCNIDDDFGDYCNSMVWRLEDLYNRLIQLLESGASYSSPIRLSEDDIKYAVPESLMFVHDVERTIEYQKEILCSMRYDYLEDNYYKEDHKPGAAFINPFFKSEQINKEKEGAA